ncbi:OmpA family protein [Azospirillum lipoferum]|uniref:Outer membrane protein, OmpA family n=1 Tax=Azospirillum lipoferum (strain 4B) TaxID=862719 RepID=G7ZGE4_AZOL4|nr:OmpA family protein [Azospirillum lipoferum]CBS90934.1 putative outer membrane protein, OmpA family [Azospirillum lipoferum 4B]
MTWSDHREPTDIRRALAGFLLTLCTLTSVPGIAAQDNPGPDVVYVVTGRLSSEEFLQLLEAPASTPGTQARSPDLVGRTQMFSAPVGEPDISDTAVSGTIPYSVEFRPASKPSPTAPQPSPSLPSPSLPSPKIGAGKAESGKVAVAYLINFSTNSAALNNAARETVNVIGGALRLQPALAITLSGHADRSGSDAINDPLSLQRAIEVRNQIVAAYSIDPTRIAVEGYGSRQPLPGVSEFDPRNRRVQVVLRK